MQLPSPFFRYLFASIVSKDRIISMSGSWFLPLYSHLFVINRRSMNWFKGNNNNSSSPDDDDNNNRTRSSSTSKSTFVSCKDDPEDDRLLICVERTTKNIKDSNQPPREEVQETTFKRTKAEHDFGAFVGSVAPFFLKEILGPEALEQINKSVFALSQEEPFFASIFPNGMQPPSSFSYPGIVRPELNSSQRPNKDGRVHDI